MYTQQIRWLLDADEPWTRYRTQIDLLDQHPDDPDVKNARSEMINHPMVKNLIYKTSKWPGYAIKRHNDSNHPIYTFSTLADFGVQASDPGMDLGIAALLSHQSIEGAFETLINIPKAFGGRGEEQWTWVLCDAPTLLYALLVMGIVDDCRIQSAINHLIDLGNENGWRCVASNELGKFKGPGRKTDPCPIANVYALKVLALVPDYRDSTAARAGTEMLLNHWEKKFDHKLFLFGTGTDFKKLKYPFVWYDLLHVVEVLSQFHFIHDDNRFQTMITTITSQADQEGRYTAGSMYLPWKGWSFANKKEPSPWLTFLVMRILRRIN